MVVCILTHTSLTFKRPLGQPIDRNILKRGGSRHFCFLRELPKRDLLSSRHRVAIKGSLVRIAGAVD